MSLSALIRKRRPGNFATATVATLATVQPKSKPSVATVATVAVANPKAPQTDNGKPFSHWLFHFADRDELPVTFAPAVDHAAALAYYPDAVAAEPIPDRPQRVANEVETNEIRALIGIVFANETDVDHSEALAAALADPDGALRCYRSIAEGRGIAIAATGDDRRTCSQCLNLRGRACAIAKPGGLVLANPGYRPATATLQRCAGYLPNTTDHDQRPGSERWPGL